MVAEKKHNHYHNSQSQKLASIKMSKIEEHRAGKRQGKKGEKAKLKHFFHYNVIYIFFLFCVTTEVNLTCECIKKENKNICMNIVAIPLKNSSKQLTVHPSSTFQNDHVLWFNEKDEVTNALSFYYEYHFSSRFLCATSRLSNILIFYFVRLLCRIFLGCTYMIPCNAAVNSNKLLRYDTNGQWKYSSK